MIRKEYGVFDWRDYLGNHKDLKHIKEKEEAWNHWIQHGKKEGRTYYKKLQVESLKNFDWKVWVRSNF